MKQISFAQAEHQNKKKVTRRERFLAQMNALVPWQRLIDALSPSYFPNSAGAGPAANRPGAHADGLCSG
ncbi:hypothetical protein VRRI112168_08185 [Vreelandella rituensis]